jgi:hypothetical protein
MVGNSPMFVISLVTSDISHQSGGRSAVRRPYPTDQSVNEAATGHRKYLL